MATPVIHSSVLTRRGALAAAASTLLLSACGRDGRGTGGTWRSAAPDAPELVIGASLELTGRAAGLGVLQQRALQITLAVLNANGVKIGNQRRTVRLEVRDNASDPKLAARQASELAARDNVHALLGGTLAETSLGIIEAAQRIRIPFISLAYGDNIVRPLADRTFVYKVTPDARDVAAQLVRLIGEHKHRRVALLAGAGMHGDSGVEAMASAASGAGLHLIRVARLPVTGSDFRPIARTVRAKKPDAVVIWGHPPDSGAAARALRTSSYSGPIYFDAAAVAEDTLSTRNAGAVEGAYVIHPISLNASTLTSSTMGALARRDFTFRYIQQYGGFSGFAPYASDALTLIADAARSAGSVDRGRIRAYLRSQVGEGMAGPYAFAPSRHSGMERASLGVYTVDNGAWTRIS